MSTLRGNPQKWLWEILVERCLTELHATAGILESAGNAVSIQVVGESTAIHLDLIIPAKADRTRSHISDLYAYCISYLQLITSSH